MLLVALVLTILLPQEGAPTAAATVNSPQRAADGTQRWSVLADPCASAQDGTSSNSIVVCGKGVNAPRLPLPDERGPPDRPMPSNPERTGIAALNATVEPCAARMEGCTVGVDLFGGTTAAVRLVGKLFDPDSCCEEPGESRNFFKLVGDAGKGIGRAFRKKPDKSNRVPIDLSDPASDRPSPAALPTPPGEPESPTGATGGPSRGL
ncbi:hypothetical protein ACNFJ7_10235 [Sphingomonas sp. HT-1]|uniref:hypothetical protein n=1 Tax=unclassified Sphingomonas TaxID=196159 RepID=UPI000474754E|nr:MULTISPECIES: hypothetical protein [unclassified Sphingomonas]KTF70081.1 hypothetical protein ATB93_06325 [Sphingomonas sp. WG]